MSRFDQTEPVVIKCKSAAAENTVSRLFRYLCFFDRSSEYYLLLQTRRVVIKKKKAKDVEEVDDN